MKIYPSGFLGSATVQMTAPLTAQEIGRRLFDVATLKTNDSYTANLDVTQLWERYLAGADDVRSFEFLENLIAVAKVAFGTTNFQRWMLSQEKSPFITSTHIAYIDDTLGYIYMGLPRKYHFNVWQDQLVLRPEIGVRITKSANYVSLFERGNPPKDISMVIRMWIERGGIRDLLESLYILFGTR